MSNRFTLHYSYNGIPKIVDEVENKQYCNLDTQIYIILQVLNGLDDENQYLNQKCDFLINLLEENGITYMENMDEENTNNENTNEGDTNNENINDEDINNHMSNEDTNENNDDGNGFNDETENETGGE